MARDLEIRYRVDDSQSKRSAEAEIARAKQVEAAWKRVAAVRTGGSVGGSSGGTGGGGGSQPGLASLQKQLDAAKKAADKADADRIKSDQRVADLQAKTSQRAADAAQKAQDKVAAAYQRAADAAEKAAQRALDADLKASLKRADAATKAGQKIQEAARKAAEAQAQAAQKAIDAEAARVAKLDQMGKQVLSREEVQLRARTQANQRYQQQRVDDAARIMMGESEAASMSDKLAEAGGRIVAGFMGIQAVERIFQEIGQAIAQSREQAIQYAETLLDTKDKLAEIATLRGLAFADDDFIKKMAGFSKATGLTMVQSDQFQRQLFGSSAGGLQLGNVDEDTLEKASVLTGQAAARQTKDFGTRGDLVGMITQFHKFDRGDAGAKQIASETEAVRLGLTEGRGDDAPLTKSLLNLAGKMIGEGMPVGDIKQLAALVGTTSLTAGPLGADTRADQLQRALQGSTPKQVEMLKDKFKIDEHDTLEQRLDKVIPALRAQRAAGRDVGTYLVENGFNAEQKDALLEMSNKGYEIFKTRLDKARSAVGGDKIAADNAAFDASPVGRQKKGQAALFAAELERGKQREALQAEMPAAEADIVKEENLGSFIMDIPRWINSGFTIPGRQQRIQERALQRMRERAGVGYSPVEVAAGSDRGNLGAPLVSGIVGGAMGTDSAGLAAQYYQAMIDLKESLNRNSAATEANNAMLKPQVTLKAPSTTPQVLPAGPIGRVGR